MSRGSAIAWRHITQDRRDILEVLQSELDFLEQGGYGLCVRTPWIPTSMFQDSLACINFNNPGPPHPCSECPLHQFVPEPARLEKIPCHHIPLNEKGDTIRTLEKQETHARVEEAVKTWLRATIEQIEQERAQKPRPDARSGSRE